jgi:hypothetical protein
MLTSHYVAHHFEAIKSGGFALVGSHSLPRSTPLKLLHEVVKPSIGDVVKVFGHYLEWMVSPHTGEVKWRALSPHNPRVVGLYAQIQAAEAQLEG